MGVNNNKIENTILPLVTVMMPVYNGERTIELAINSLLRQTYINWLCVIVNDCSTDNTVNIIQVFENDLRFKIIHLPKNVGRGAARQIALDNSEGKYLAFLDADDFYHPEKLKKQIDILENTDVALVSTGLGAIDRAKNLVAVRAKGDNKSRLFHFGDKFRGFCPSNMLRLDVAKKYRYNPILDVSEDVDYIIRYLDKRSFIILDRIYYYYDEIGSVTSKKIFTYQLKSLVADYYTIYNMPIYGFKRIFITIFKIIAYSILLPIYGTERIVKSRGIEPSIREKEEYLSEYNILNGLINKK